ncbi:hypothetical protein RJ639_040763 [Escallonia herrerae]|uniref:Glutaredoxin domain-containing protein n=1 Tax=Escallonia herrerae TaxID=1293975 RepID=A0AA88WE44_9ASTE|nr:hypothetical protein RJ639_040763 [Escallonia herrerae]
MRFSTTVPTDPDTHEDFQPTNKLESSGLSLKDIVEQDVKDNSVMIYMKGEPALPRCGFSSLAVKVLREYKVPLAARNILEDPELKSAVKAFSYSSSSGTVFVDAFVVANSVVVERMLEGETDSNWPTFPQIFIKGEFVGGSDIILNMHKTGELKEMLKGIGAADAE